MALVYSEAGSAIDNEADYAVFKAFFVGLSDNDALAFADRLAEKARLLRKAVLNKSIVSDTVTAWGTALGAHSHSITPDTLVEGKTESHNESYQYTTILPAALALFKAANNDI